MLDKITNYFLKQADKMTAWIGIIGLILLFLHLGGFLFILFIALIVLPQDEFSKVFAGWTKELRTLDKKTPKKD